MRRVGRKTIRPSDTLHTLMRFHHALVFLVALTTCVFAQSMKPVVERVAAQNALFEEQYESDLRNFPERATAFGDYRYNDKLAELLTRSHLCSAMRRTRHSSAD